MNGGNAAAPRENPNLESGDGGARSDGAAVVSMAETQDSSDKTQSMAGGNADAQEVNGELRGPPRKYGAQLSRRKMRKFKANSMESDAMEAPGTRGRKRKLSEYEDASSEDSEEFNGFDSQGVELQPGSNVLKKLIGRICYCYCYCIHGIFVETDYVLKICLSSSHITFEIVG